MARAASVNSFRWSTGGLDFFYLDPGDYYMRLFNDRNGNGQWDEGCYAEGRQAKEVYYFPQAFSIRANWDVEQTWRLNELPLIEQKPRELINKRRKKRKATPEAENAANANGRNGSSTPHLPFRTIHLILHTMKRMLILLCWFS